MRWFGLSFASVPKCKERFARHPSQAQFTILRVVILMLLQALSRSLAVAGAHVQAFTFIALAPNTTRNKDTTQTTHTNTHNTRRQTQRKRRDRKRCSTFQAWEHVPSMMCTVPGISPSKMVEFVRLDKSVDMTNRTAAKLYIIKNNNSARVKNCNRSTA